jgi:HK97 family phage prohead protease
MEGIIAEKLIGAACVFGKQSVIINEDGKRFREVISPSAFDDLFINDEGCIANVEHLMEWATADKERGHLQLWVNSEGLYFAYERVDGLYANEKAFKHTKEGTFKKCSFAFKVYASDISWSICDDGVLLRTVNKISALGDVSIVKNPAYKDTHVKYSNDAQEIKSHYEDGYLKQYYKDLKKRLSLVA